MSAPIAFDTDFRVVVCWNDDALQSSVAEVFCFEFYGPAFQFWRSIDQGEVKLAVPSALVEWVLIDPNGLCLLTQASRLSSHELGQAEPGRYRWNDAAEVYQGHRVSEVQP